MLGTNIGAYITTKFALARTAFGVGVGNLGNTDGVKIDRTAVRPLHVSGKLQIGYKLTMASGESCALTAAVRHATTENGAYADLETGAFTIQANDDGSAVVGVAEVDVDLIGARAWLQSRVAATLTASGSDAAEVFGLLTVGGGELIPPTESEQ